MTLKFKWETEFKQTEIGKVPREWGIEKLGKAVKVKHGFAFPSKYFKDYGEIPVIKIQNIQDDNSINLENCQFVVPSEINKNLNKYYLKNGDILIALTGATAGKIGVLKGPYNKYFLNQRVGKCEIRNTSFSLFFIYYLLTLGFYRNWLFDLADGSAQGNMSPSDIEENIIIPFPLPQEQSRIATVLSWFDDLIENKKRQNEILEKTAMAIFKSWFVDFEPFKNEEFVYSEKLGKEIPKGWEVEELAEFVSTQYGFTASGEETGEIKLLRIKDINKDFVIDWDSVPFCNIINDIFPKYQLKNMDIVISRIGDIGKVAIVENPPLSVFASYLIRLKIKNHKLTPYYLYYWLKAPDYQEYIQGAAEGSTRPNTNAEVIKVGPILIPPPSLIEKFEEVVFPIRNKIILNQKQIMVLRKIRDALLPKLVFGKLRVEEI